MAIRPKPSVNLTISIVLTQEERRLLERAAEREGRTSMAAIIRKLIRTLSEDEKAA